MIEQSLNPDFIISKQSLIDKCFYYLLIFTLLFGVMLYDLIGFPYTDEICALLLFVLYIAHVYKTPQWEFNKLFIITLGVFFFFLCYSLSIRSNTTGAIITDFVIQIKPFLVFFCAYSIKPYITNNQKTIIRQTALILASYLLITGIISILSQDVIDFTFGHVSRFATATSIIAILYLYSSNFDNKNKFIFILILLIGIISGRSKFFGFFAFSLFFIIYTNYNTKFKLNAKNIFIFTLGILFVLFVAKDKIIYYFVPDDLNSRNIDTFARMALYYYSIPILKEYFFLGTGFATYATYASGQSYSYIYEKYNMDYIYGLTKESPLFISDTYYPALVQFGIIGIGLFFLFWLHLGLRALKGFQIGYKKEALLCILIIVFFMIECTSDSTLTHNRGMFMMMLLGLLLGDIKKQKLSITNEE